MSVNKPGIVELSKKVDCRYTLVVETSKRARQLVAGAQPLIDPKDMKPVSIAIQEVADGKLEAPEDQENETTEEETHD